MSVNYLDLIANLNKVTFSCDLKLVSIACTKVDYWIFNILNKLLGVFANFAYLLPYMLEISLIY